MKNKSFRDISWLVSEETYREDKSLNYSTLARYEREGFNGLNKLFDKVESPSLTFGSAVDSLITGGVSEFNDRFIVEELIQLPDSIKSIIDVLYRNYGDTCNSIKKVPMDAILDEARIQEYQKNWKPDTKLNAIREKGGDYYELLCKANNKTILDFNTYQDIINVVNTLKDSEVTRFYFACDNPFDESIERFYQLKFKGEFDKIIYKGMADLIIVNHKDKTIKPVDLKTSSSPEWEFYKSFIKYHYDIQARLYWNLIRQTMDKDEYFKEFKLLNYDFIVINKKTLTPLVWEYSESSEIEDITLGENNKFTFRSPFTIGKELYKYLFTTPKVPEGIKENESNNLKEWINKL